MLAKAMGGIVIGVEPSALPARPGPGAWRRPRHRPHGGRHAETVMSITGDGAEVGIETSGNDQARVDLPKATPYHARIVYVGWGGTGQERDLWADAR